MSPGSPAPKRSSAKKPAAKAAQKKGPGAAAKPGAKPTAAKAAPEKATPAKRSPARRGATALGSVLIVAGEHSGDWLGGDLVQSLRRKTGGEFFGTGGEHMLSSGVELLHTVETMNVLGFWEGLKAVPRLKKVARELVDQAVARGTRLAILIDSPGFNLRLAEMLKKHDIRVVYLVSPQIWAWKYGRIKKIRRYVDLMLTLFPFEKEMYDREDVRAECIGHPMVHRIPRDLKADEPIASQKKRTVGLLPGSRGGEVYRLLPDMLAAAELLKRRYGQIRFLIPVINPEVNAFVEAQAAAHPELSINVYRGRSLRVMEASDVVVLASGTATLEVAWFKKPMVILYRVNLFNFLLASLLLRIPWVGLVNLIAGKQVALELLQSEVTAENIEREAARLLDDREYRDRMVENLEIVRKRLGRGNPAATAAGHIEDFLAGT